MLMLPDSFQLSTPYGQAVDVGCGSGQNTNNLASYFDSVLGVDISKSQVEEAIRTNKADNVQYRFVAKSE